jgi:uncharacterized protein YhbP (UPF0306 family)
MSMEHPIHPVAAERLVAAARDLLEASSLCAIATMTPDGDAYISTAYFAWAQDFRLVWLSHPEARHSRNVAVSGTAAIAVYDSRQIWGRPDRGVQLFGTARELGGAEADEAEAVYARRFPDYQHSGFATYRFYVLAPDRVKLFDEREFGGGRFVVACADGRGGLRWETTELYSSAPD